MFVLVGAPSSPLPDSVVAKVTSVVSRVEGIAEAHMPQWFSPKDMKAAQQVLVIVSARGLDPVSLVKPVLENLAEALPEGPELLVIPMSGRDGLLNTVRGTKCRVFTSDTLEPDKKPWWRFW